MSEAASGPPVRLRLRRRKGFDLQALSRATNGRSAARVDRSTIWGNNFSAEPGRSHLMPRPRRGRDGRLRRWTACLLVADVETALARFEASLLRGKRRRRRLPDLAGLNLACWCAPGAPCHADILLRLANPDGGEPPAAPAIRCEEIAT